MIHIRTPQIEDLPALAKLFDAYRVFYHKKTDLKGATAFLNERITQQESVLFIAEIETEIVGFTQSYPLFSSTNMRRSWLLNDLYVSPEHRRKKIAQGLLLKAQEHCKQTQAQGLSLETERSNIPGNALYPKMGFHRDDAHHFYFWENPSFSLS